MIVPNVKQIAQFLQKLLAGSQNFEIWSRDPGHSHLGVVLWSRRSRVTSSMIVPNVKQIAQFVQKLLAGSQNSKLGHVTVNHAPIKP